MLLTTTAWHCLPLPLVGEGWSEGLRLCYLCRHRRVGSPKASPDNPLFDAPVGLRFANPTCKNSFVDRIEAGPLLFFAVIPDSIRDPASLVFAFVREEQDAGFLRAQE